MTLSVTAENMRVNCTGVSRERVESARLTRTIVWFPDPHIPLIASRVTVAFTVSYT